MTNETLTATGNAPKIDATYKVRLPSGKPGRQWWTLVSIDADGIADLANWEAPNVHRGVRVSSLVEVG